MRQQKGQQENGHEHKHSRLCTCVGNKAAEQLQEALQEILHEEWQAKEMRMDTERQETAAVLPGLARGLIRTYRGRAWLAQLPP
jgi:hypothetical protein